MYSEILDTHILTNTHTTDAIPSIRLWADTIRACANKPSNAPASDRLGIKHQPLLEIEPSQIIPDELHLLLRIGDVLVRNLIFEVVTAARQQRRSPQFLLSSLRQVEAAAAACGITFKIWEVKDQDGKGSGKYDSTSLMGTDMKKMLRLLPDSFDELLRAEVAGLTAQIWKVKKLFE